MTRLVAIATLGSVRSLLLVRVRDRGDFILREKSGTRQRSCVRRLPIQTQIGAGNELMEQRSIIVFVVDVA